MSGLILPRRQFLRGIVGLLAAPAIVRASSLMPVAPPPEIITADWSIYHLQLPEGWEHSVKYFVRVKFLPEPATDVGLAA